MFFVKGSMLMLDNCNYDKIKVLHELSCVAWFLEKHGLQDAKSVGDEQCCKVFENLKKDLEKHICELNEGLHGK